VTDTQSSNRAGILLIGLLWLALWLAISAVVYYTGLGYWITQHWIVPIVHLAKIVLNIK
jgi:hypothetical protein